MSLFGLPTPNYNQMLAAMNSWGGPDPTGSMSASLVPQTSLAVPAADFSGVTPNDLQMATFGTTQAAGPQSWWGGAKNWLSNGQNLNAAVNGISALTGAYLGFQQLKQAKSALNLQRDAFNANLNSKIKTYNTSLEDRIRGRTSDYAGKENDVQAYLAKHSLNR